MNSIYTLHLHFLCVHTHIQTHIHLHVVCSTEAAAVLYYVLIKKTSLNHAEMRRITLVKTVHTCTLFKTIHFNTGTSISNVPVLKKQVFNPKTTNIYTFTYLNHYTSHLIIVAARGQPAGEENGVNLVPIFARIKAMISAHLRALSLSICALAFAEFWQSGGGH